MKRSLLFVWVLCIFTALFSQDHSIVPGRDLSRTEEFDKPPLHYTSIDEDFDIPNKYIIGYHENGKQKYIWSTGFIRPIINEDECIGTGPWQGNVTILPSSMNYDIIAKEVLKPYYKIADSCSVHIATFYDLSGNLLKFELEIPAEVNIPVKAIEELDSLLKESKLILDYDPEKAKYVNYITLSTIPFLIRELDTSLKTEYEKTDSNTYVIKYYDFGIKETSSRSRYFKFISNINNPYEGIGTGWWQRRINILSSSAEPTDIAEEVLAPYSKGTDCEKGYVSCFYDLNGDLQYFNLGIPAEKNIPVKVIEELENRLKKESKLKLKYDPEKAKYVNFIRFSNLINL